MAASSSPPDPSESRSDCEPSQVALPAAELARYAYDRDVDSEQDITRYVESQAPDESVQHVERIKTEVALGDSFEVWDVTTDKNRWWVITNLTNLYSKEHFPSLDFVLSFHIGLMIRLRSRPTTAAADDRTPFDDVFRRQAQAKTRYDTAIEAEDFQAVGMLLRECLLSLVAALRRRTPLPDGVNRPQDANFIAWNDVLMDKLCPGGSNKELRHHLKGIGKDTWQLVNWLTHDRSANRTAASIAIHACDTFVGHSIQVLTRSETDHSDACPICSSRMIREHFDPMVDPDGAYYQTCGICGWSSHPSSRPAGSDAPGI